MKFKDIKEGDEVMVRKIVKRSLFDMGISFWVPAKVERATRKQFIVNGNKYRKENGIAIGIRCQCKLVGEVPDETKKIDALERKIAMIHAIRERGEALTRMNHDSKNIKEIYSLLKQIDPFLKG